MGWLSAAESTLGVGVPPLGSDERFSSGLGGHLCIAVQPGCSWASTAQGPASSVTKGANRHRLWLPELHGFPAPGQAARTLEVRAEGSSWQVEAVTATRNLKTQRLDSSTGRAPSGSWGTELGD